MQSKNDTFRVCRSVYLLRNSQIGLHKSLFNVLPTINDNYNYLIADRYRARADASTS